MLGDEACVIRPWVDAELLASPHLQLLAPLLSPVLPVEIPDNEATRHIKGEARNAASVDLMAQARSSHGHPSSYKY